MITYCETGEWFLNDLSIFGKADDYEEPEYFDLFPQLPDTDAGGK